MTDADVSEITVFLQAYRQQTAPIVIDDIRLEANNGTPTPEPINPPPVDTTPPDETPTDPAPPEELPPRVGNNLVRNADFSTGDLSGWQSSGPAGAATLSDGVLKLAATQDNTIRVEQMITGLQPETRYSFSVKLRFSKVRGHHLVSMQALNMRRRILPRETLGKKNVSPFTRLLTAPRYDCFSKVTWDNQAPYFLMM